MKKTTAKKTTAKKTTTKKMNTQQLRTEYRQAQLDGKNLLQWCAAKATEHGLTYGEFVTKLGI